MKVIRMKELTQKIGLGKSTIYRKINAKQFPVPFTIGMGRAAGWLESDIDEWIRQQLPPGR
ncbi:MAG: helix-turn-helix transcriptional regulator [Janthinobacterium lividum]